MLTDHPVVSNAESDAFSDRIFGVAAHIVGVVVEKWKGHFSDRMPADAAEKYVRGSVGLAFLAVAVSQLKPIGMTREAMIQQLDEALLDWPSEATSEESKR